ncbi:MAG: helix-turn-helix transcriptional regulator [Actinomycetales bacterium]|jgi:ArsR family transcriptional regulator|nr:helix-turn-helix transcriptional regulator [Actinomycetales bacterium]
MTTLPVLQDACCAPITEEALTADQAAVLSARLKALAEPARLRLISLLAAAPDGERCVCDLTAPLGLSQPTVSHHLGVLHKAGLVTREKRGTWAYYAVVPEALASLAAVLTPAARS